MATRFLRPVAGAAVWDGTAGAAAAWAGVAGVAPVPASAKPAHMASTTKHNTAFLILASRLRKFGGTELPVPRRLTPGATLVNPESPALWKNERGTNHP